MNIIFLTVCRITDVSHKGIYTDLLRKFVEKGHSVYAVTPSERRYGGRTELVKSEGVHLLKVKTLNIQKANYIEKGVGMLLMEKQYMSAIDKFIKNIRFDLILYSTPPITLNRVISRLKERNNAVSYLMLKDIFPQNAVDLGLFSKRGFLYKMFRKKEERLYEISDYIGCTSPGNIEFVLKHNSMLNPHKVEICPNSVELQGLKHGDKTKSLLLKQMGIPQDKTLYLYGGNLGKPQGIEFLLQVVKANEDYDNTFIIIIGGGTDYPNVKEWFDKYKPENSVLISYLPKSKYDEIVSLCDVGLVFLDRRFTVPNTPSRILPYMECKIPILFATDISTDIGRIAYANHFGLWTESGNLQVFMSMMQSVADDDEKRITMGKAGYKYLLENYTVGHTYKSIMSHFVN